jgi:hypothetical protein
VALFFLGNRVMLAYFSSPASRLETAFPEADIQAVVNHQVVFQKEEKKPSSPIWLYPKEPEWKSTGNFLPRRVVSSTRDS